MVNRCRSLEMWLIVDSRRFLARYRLTFSQAFVELLVPLMPAFKQSWIGGRISGMNCIDLLITGRIVPLGFGSFRNRH